MESTRRGAFGLEGRCCVVTGAAAGIGRGIALALAAEGARVALLDRDSLGAEETGRLVRAAGAEALVVGCDTSDAESVAAAQAQVAAGFGDAEVLVNNAGIIGAGGTLLDLAVEDWSRLLSINLTGYFLCSQAFGRPMVARGSGALVHVVSISALAAIPHAGNYSVAKAGAAMMSQLFAAEMGRHGVRSNVVHPGLVQTPMTQRSYDDPEVARARAAAVPVGRVAQPEDIAQAVLFLASPLSGYVNGAELLVDGGTRANLMASIPSRRKDS